MKFLAVLTVRNEAAFLLEWLAHHRAVGFTDFLIFSNDCDDGTDAMLDQLAASGLITHVRNDGPHDRGVQWSALKLADKHPLVKAADWTLTLDIDEFVNIHVGDHTLTALLDALPDATAITLTWRLFGNSGVVQFKDQPIVEQFTNAAPAVMHWPWRAAMFKTLFKNDGVYAKLGVHRPRSPDPDTVETSRWFDGHGRELLGPIKRKQLFSHFGRDNYSLVQLNHYALGAMESYILKRDRGRSNRNDGAHGMSYWVERNWCVEKDPSIEALKNTRDTNVAKLKDDPILSELHQKAVAWRKDRFEELMQEEENRALMGRLVMTPASRPVSPKLAEFLFRFGQKPRPGQD